MRANYQPNRPLGSLDEHRDQPTSFVGKLLELQLKWHKARRDGKLETVREQLANELNELAALLWRELGLI